VSWGAIGDAGYLARHEKVKDALQSHMGGTALESDAALAVLEQLLAANASGLGVLDFSWSNLRRFLPTAASPRFRELWARRDDPEDNSERKDELRRLANELSPEDLHALFTDLLRKEVGEILRIPPDRLDTHRPLQELGMDSLMGVELLTAVEARFGVDLPVMSLSEGPSIDKLVDRLTRAMKDPADAGDRNEAHESHGTHVGVVAAQYASELDAKQVDALVHSIDEARSGVRGHD
jgi:acyl carrier protein